jgi:hypothetical protein
MASLLTFLRPLRYDTVRTVLVVQSGPVDLAIRVSARVRALFPGCRVAGLVREYDHAAVGPTDFDDVTIIRWEDRLEVVRKLRARHWDAVVVLHSVRESQYLRLLPYLLRTRAVLLFNDHLDYFPVSLLRMRDLAHHLSGRGGMGSLLRWLATRAVLVPVAVVVLLGSTARIYVRAAVRRA